MRILVVNGGSSSLKCRVDEISADPPSAPPAPLWKENFDLNAATIEERLQAVPGPIDVVGHRIVHGGSLVETTRVTDAVRAIIAREAEIAPAHNQIELRMIDAAERIFSVPQIAVFDAGFHATLAPPAYVYPGPYEWFEHGIRRYGFHGISHQYCASRAASLLGRELRSLRIVTCHLGNGC